jgi:hypothetical protein
MWLVAITAPWVAFKVQNGLPFGNAKTIPQFEGWQDNVLLAVFINTFFEANWLLLPSLLIGLLLVRFRTAFRSPLLVFTVYFLVVFGVQLSLYLFTGLSAEALRQTGYARGLIHLAPVAATLAGMLLYDLVARPKR